MLSVRLVTSTYRSATTPRMVENGGYGGGAEGGGEGGGGEGGGGSGGGGEGGGGEGGGGEGGGGEGGGEGGEATEATSRRPPPACAGCPIPL